MLPNLFAATNDRSVTCNHRGCGANRWRRVALVLVAALGLFGPKALATPGPHDLQLLAQSLSFLRHPPSGPQQVGVVYPANSATGRAEAEQIAAQFDGGVRAGALTLTPRILTVEDVTHSTGVLVLVLTNAALPDAHTVAAAIAGDGVLTAAFELTAIRSDDIVMAISGTPRVEIYLNRAAAVAAGTEFSTAFRMMIQER